MEKKAHYSFLILSQLNQVHAFKLNVFKILFNIMFLISSVGIAFGLRDGQMGKWFLISSKLQGVLFFLQNKLFIWGTPDLLFIGTNTFFWGYVFQGVQLRIILHLALKLQFAQLFKSNPVYNSCWGAYFSTRALTFPYTLVLEMRISKWFSYNLGSMLTTYATHVTMSLPPF